MTDSFAAEALGLLRKLTGDPEATFRSGQFSAIRKLVDRRQRLLLVQSTGWGKSAVYFIATRMLRDRGAGPTLLVSPLLALMRNQIEAAERMDVQAATINSSNQAQWKNVEGQIRRDAVDILLISPERLANQVFRRELLPSILQRSGLLVIDEAHCISDWGHDFRPDYRRISKVLGFLSGVPILCCTATANNRVIDDITSQLGSGLETVRGPLARSGLQLHVLEITSQAERLTWLADLLAGLEGTGVVYCLTIRDAQRVAEWLDSCGIPAVPYWGGLNTEDRVGVEQALMSNEVKVVVATPALGMGFDKPDVSFVIHYQSPGSPIAYYQQVGRAGRALDESWGILLRGGEDTEIQDYFIHRAFPPAHVAERVVGFLEERAEPVSRDTLFQWVNIRGIQLDSLLKNLEVEGAVEREGSAWRRTLRRWTFDRNRVEEVTALRRVEQAQMLEFVRTDGCRMQLLGSYLDDPAPMPCGLCDNCTGRSLETHFDPVTVQRAVKYLRKIELIIEPRKQWPDRKKIPESHSLQRGRVLAIWGDGGWGALVRSGKREDGHFGDQLVAGAADLIGNRWVPQPFPAWVASVPSLRCPELVQTFAARLAALLDLPYKNVIEKVRDTEPQKSMQNSHQQYRNVRDAFGIHEPVPSGPVLLVDDIVDSKWTFTVVGGLLRVAGAELVYPFALADAARRSVK